MAIDTRTARKAQASPPRRGLPARQPPGASISLTSRGAIVGIGGLSLFGMAFGGLVGLRAPMGFAFVAGCVMAALWTRRHDLLRLVVTPPLIFFVVTLIGEFFGALNEPSVLRSTLVAVVTQLAGAAPWLFAGTVLTAAIALPRGLLADLLALRRQPDPSDDPVRWDETPA